MGTYIDMTFYTNSSDDRNQLIKKLFSIEGTKIDSKKLNEWNTTLVIISKLMEK